MAIVVACDLSLGGGPDSQLIGSPAVFTNRVHCLLALGSTVLATTWAPLPSALAGRTYPRMCSACPTAAVEFAPAPRAIPKFLIWWL